MKNKTLLLAILAPSLVASSLAAHYKIESSRKIASINTDVEVLKEQLEAARASSERLLAFCDSSKCAEEIEMKLAHAESTAEENRILSRDLEKQKSMTTSLKADHESMQRMYESKIEQIEALYASDMQSMESAMNTMQSNYQELAETMEDRLEQKDTSIQKTIQAKEREFEEIHRRSINNVIGKIDSLAKRKVSEIIPLISHYDSREILDNFICGDQAELTPDETIFSKFLHQHWLTWRVTIEDTMDGISHGVTDKGDHLIINWENPKNLYDFGEDQSTVVQFQLGENLECGKPLELSRAVISTTSG